MSNQNSLLENEELETVAQEAVEEVTEEVIEEVTEEIVEETTQDACCNAEEVLEDEEKKVYTRVSLIKAVIITLVVCVALMVAEYYIIDANINHYNLNKDGYEKTLDNAAEQTGVTVEEFKEVNGLPAEMPGDTIVVVAQNYITVGKWLEIQGMGDDMLPMFLQMYGVDESAVTKDMLMGEFNKIVEEAQKAAAESAPAEGEAAPAEGEEAPAEGEAAPAEGEATPAEGEEAPAEGESAPAENQ